MSYVWDDYAEGSLKVQRSDCRDRDGTCVWKITIHSRQSAR